MFESTLLQELEWHVHTALFALVLGYGYIWNTHVRVDLVRENLAFRKKAWLELVGLTVFMIPFCLVVIWFASIYTYDFVGDPRDLGIPGRPQPPLDHQERAGGRPDRRRLVRGRGLAAGRDRAVGAQNIRFPLMTLEWPEEAGSKIEGKERIKLEELEEAEWDTETDTLRRPAKAGAASGD